MSVEEWLRLIDILKWPVAALLGVLVFRKGIETLLARIQRAALGSRSVDFAEPAALASEQQQQRQIANPTSGEAAGGEGPPPAPAPALRLMEEPIAAAVAASNTSEDIKRAWLIRGVAIARLERAHETTYRLILGSQIALLLQANIPIPFDADGARAIYDDAKARYPDLYKTFEFETWLNWPANSGLTIIERDTSNRSIIKITEIGKDFLHYLVNMGLTSTKYG
jgi:hypothetical protein